MSTALPAHLRPPIHPLTSLRFFAALNVVFHHFYAGALPSKPLPELINRIIALAYVGPSFFFILSGFILAYNYLGPAPSALHDGAAAPAAEGRDLQSGSARRGFYLARFARIYPIYLLALLIQVPFVAAHRFEQDPTAFQALGKFMVSFMVNATLVQGWLRKLWGGWNSPGWSLSSEAFLYAVFPFIAPLVYRSRRNDLTLLVGIYLLALAVPSAALLLERSGQLHLVGYEDIETFPLLRLPEFLFGVVIARVHVRARASGDAAPFFRRPAAIYVAAILILLAATLAQDSLPHLLLHIGLLSPAFGLLILGMSRGNDPFQRLLSIKSLVTLGEASYGLYILHFPFYIWCCYLAQPATTLASSPQPFPQGAPGFFAVYVVVLVVLSWVSLRFYEDPARRWIRKLAAR